MKLPSKIIRLNIFILIFLCLLLWSARIQSGLADQAPASFMPILLRAWPPPTPTPRPGAVLITEILYDSAGIEPDQEWIELYNPGDLPFPLTKVWLGDEETPGGTEGMFRFPDGTFLHGGQIIIIANRASAFVKVYGRAPDFEFVASDAGVPDLIKDKQWAIGNIELTNNADEVLLRDISAAVIDGVSWGLTAFWILRRRAWPPDIRSNAARHSLIQTLQLIGETNPSQILGRWIQLHRRLHPPRLQPTLLSRLLRLLLL